MVSVLAWRWPRDLSGRSPVVPWRIVKVRDYPPAWAGIHPSIKSGRPTRSSRPDGWEYLPTYVSRDVDVEVRSAIAAAKGGCCCFILLVGTSSAGKTRCAYEAVRVTLGEWDIVIPPRDPSEMPRLFEEAEQLKRPIIWLDEIQKYLPQEGRPGLAKPDILRLLGRDSPAVIIGTIWPDRFQSFTEPPPPHPAPDVYAGAREVLSLARVIRVPATFSEEEMERAREVSKHDPRLRVALNDKDYGPTQVLAGAPDLIQRWQDADPYSMALINAAVDIQNIGVIPPLGRSLLKDAAASYLTSRDFARAASDWFEHALSYSLTELRGATSVLIPCVGDARDQVVGYEVADYVLQHGQQSRATVSVPGGVWDALAEDVADPSQLLLLAQRADRRLLYGYAEPLFERAVHAGHAPARRYFARYLAKRRRDAEAIEQYRAASDGGDVLSNKELGQFLVRRRRVAEGIVFLKKAVEAGDSKSAVALGRVLEDEGDPDGAIEAYLIAVQAGAANARKHAARLLNKQGRHAEAESLKVKLQDPWWMQVVEGLVRQGHLDDAIEECARALGGDRENAVLHVAKYGLKHGFKEKSLDLYHSAATLGSNTAARSGARVMVQRGYDARAEQLLRLAICRGDENARQQLTFYLARWGRTEEAIELNLQAAKENNARARKTLYKLLARIGRIDEAIGLCRIGVRMGDPSASYDLVRLLRINGQAEEARRLLRHGLNIDHSVAGSREEAAGSMNAFE